MLEKEIQGKDQIYHICVRYKKPTSTKLKISGHMIKAKTPKLALEIANKYHIGNPMGKAENIKNRSLQFKEPVSLNFCLKRQGNIWYENKDGNLKGLKITI